MMYSTTNSFPYVGSGWKESRLSLSGVVHLPGKTRYRAATRHNPEGYIVPQAMGANGLCHERRQSLTRLGNRSTDDRIDTEPCQRFIEPVKKHEFFARTSGNKRL